MDQEPLPVGTPLAALSTQSPFPPIDSTFTFPTTTSRIGLANSHAPNVGGYTVRFPTDWTFVAYEEWQPKVTSFGIAAPDYQPNPELRGESPFRGVEFTFSTLELPVSGPSYRQEDLEYKLQANVHGGSLYNLSKLELGGKQAYTAEEQGLATTRVYYVQIPETGMLKISDSVDSEVSQAIIQSVRF
jgi:hypothetical protein